MDSVIDDILDKQIYNFGNWEITAHNRNQFELRIDYRIDPLKESSSFKINTYFFVPESFGINSFRYSKEKFYEELKAYIKFKTRLFPFKNILDPENDVSPLLRLERLLDSSSSVFSPSAIQKAIYELKMLANLSTVYVSNEVAFIANILHISSKSSQNGLIIAEQRIADLIQDLKSFWKSISGLESKIRQFLISNDITTAFEMVIEFISLKFQQELTKLLSNLEELKDKWVSLINLSEEVRNLIKSERGLRLTFGFKSVIETDSDNEIFTYRFNALKKYISNVLYLTARPKKRPRVLQELAYASIAGLAMFIAFLLAYFTQLYLSEYLIPFIAAIVISYMIKDRLKEWGRLLIGGRVSFLQRYDHQSKIKDHLGNVIGDSREKFKFINYKKIPSDIVQYYEQMNVIQTDDDATNREIVSYAKHIELYPKLINYFHKRVLDASDIIRYDITNFLPALEESFSRIQWFNVEKDRIERVRTSRVYYLILIVKFTVIDEKKNELSKIDGVRVILDKKGIKSIEKVSDIKI